MWAIDPVNAVFIAVVHILWIVIYASLILLYIKTTTTSGVDTVEKTVWWLCTVLFSCVDMWIMWWKKRGKIDAKDIPKVIHMVFHTVVHTHLFFTENSSYIGKYPQGQDGVAQW